MAHAGHTHLRFAEAHAGEVRINLIRLVAVLAFYSNHLVAQYFLLQPEPVSLVFHKAVSCVVLLWVLLIIGVYRWTSLGHWSVRGALVIQSTDLALIGSLIAIVPRGPQSALVVLLLLVVAAAPLRLNLGLVWGSTVGAALVYLLVLGHYVFVRVGASDYYQADSTLRIPRTTEVITLVAIGVAGLLAGQTVRQTNRLLRASAMKGDEIDG